MLMTNDNNMIIHNNDNTLCLKPAFHVFKFDIVNTTLLIIKLIRV